MIILQILGGIFLIVVCVVGFFVWKIFRFAKKHSNSDIQKAISVLPAQGMYLEPANVSEWKEQERLAYIESELKKVGASHVGYFCVYSGFALIRVSMWNYKNGAVVVIYEAQQEAASDDEVVFIFEVAGKLNDGSLCITSNANAVYDSRPAKHIIEHSESESILDFIRVLKRSVPTGKKLQKIEDPKAFFTECYEDTAEWAWRKEQLESNKTQQTFSSIGVEVTDEIMETLIDMGESYSIEVNNNRVRSKLAKHSTMSVEQWEKIRDDLIFINEKMKSQHVVDAIYQILGELTEKQEQVIDGFEENKKDLIDPIETFHMLAQALNLKVKRLAKMNSPIKTEVFLPL